MLPLLPARFHAFALDQRGHGASERPSCCYTVDDLAADTVAFLDGLVAFDDAADLGGITASTLLIWGDHDAVVSLEDQQRLRDAIPAARLKVYPETGHSPHWERPERVAADLRPTASPVEWTAAVGVLAMITLAITWLSVARGLQPRPRADGNLTKASKEAGTPS